MQTMLERAAAPRQWRPWLAFTVMISYFVMFGISFGSQGVIWNDLIQTLQISKGVFGTAQLASPLVSMILLTQASAICA